MAIRTPIAESGEAVPTLRDRVVLAGERLFRADGYAAVSMDTIAAELGVSKKTLYTAVRSKEEILSDIIEHSLRSISEHIDIVFDRPDLSFVEKAAHWFVFLRFIHDNVTPTELIRDIQRNAPQAWRLIRLHARQRTERIGAFFHSGLQSGEVRRDLDTRIAARLYSSCSAGILEESVLTGVKLRRQRAFEVFGQLFYTGMFTAEARKTLQKVRELAPMPSGRADVETESSVGTDLRARIIHAGRTHFFRLGYSKVRMDEIATETGISKKTLYNNFSSKEDLLREVLREFANGVAESTLTVSDESIFEYVRSLRTFIITMANRLSEITPQFVRDLARTAPEFLDELLAWRSDAIDTRFAAVLHKGQRIHAIRSDISASHLARVYRVVLDSALRPDELTQDDILPVDMYRTIVNAMFIGNLEDSYHSAFVEAYDACLSSRPSMIPRPETSSMKKRTRRKPHAD